jgi:peptide-methionine (R)-S-oxide reductase
MNTILRERRNRAGMLGLGALLGGAALLSVLSSARSVMPEPARGQGARAPAGIELVSAGKATGKAGKGVGRVVKSEAEWRKILTSEQFEVLRQEGTERPFSSDSKPRKKPGVFRCAGCGLDLFRSEKMFDSGTGWPSFWAPIAGHVHDITDADGERVETQCARCDGHLGHVFEDGPAPTGLRYCMNAVAMKFTEDKKK